MLDSQGIIIQYYLLKIIKLARISIELQGYWQGSFPNDKYFDWISFFNESSWTVKEVVCIIESMNTISLAHDKSK